MGKAVQKQIPDDYYPSREDYDLMLMPDIERLPGNDGETPPQIIHLAAKAGGIMDNIKRPENYFYENVMVNTQLVRWALTNGIKRFLGILSTCAYPDFENCKYINGLLLKKCFPMQENTLHEGPPAESNFAYGYAKRMMAVHIDACNEQYGTQYNYLIPCNLYSGEVYRNPDKSHFLDMLLTKIKYAKNRGTGYIELMGTGRGRRQFMLTDDFARVIKEVVDRDITESFNVCPSNNPTIREIAELALDVCDATNIEIRWNSAYPDGQLDKQASNKKMTQYLPDFRFTPLADGIRMCYERIP